MAGGIDWFRWHHGSVTDPKFALVARRAGASLPDVLAVWAYLLEQASASVVRGTFGDVDCEAWDCLFGFPATETRTADILRAMKDRGLIGDGAVIRWDKRQPKREREGDTSTDRVRLHRAMKRHETPLVANATSGTPREEESREELPPASRVPPAADAATTPPKAKRKPATTPMPADFAVSARVQAWATAKGYDRLSEHLEAFKRKVAANGYQKVSWDDFFMEAVREDWAKLRGGKAGFAPPPDIRPGPDAAAATRAYLDRQKQTPEERAASEEARIRVMSALKVVS